MSDWSGRSQKLKGFWRRWNDHGVGEEANDMEIILLFLLILYLLTLPSPWR